MKTFANREDASRHRIESSWRRSPDDDSPLYNILFGRLVAVLAEFQCASGQLSSNRRRLVVGGKRDTAEFQTNLRGTQSSLDLCSEPARNENMGDFNVYYRSVTIGPCDIELNLLRCFRIFDFPFPVFFAAFWLLTLRNQQWERT